MSGGIQDVRVVNADSGVGCLLFLVVIMAFLAVAAIWRIEESLGRIEGRMGRPAAGAGGAP